MDDAAHAGLQTETRQAAGPAWLALLFLAPAALLFYARPGCPLQEPQEPRYAEIARQMQATDSLVVPVYHGTPYLDKPPLLYWLVMASYALFGVHDWAARLVPSTAGFLCVLIVYGWARQATNSRAALLGALCLCLSPRFVQLERLLTMDALLCLWVILAWAAAHAAVQHGLLSGRWWLASALASGLGLLSKGPVALVLVVMPVLVYQVLDRRSARPRLIPWLLYLTVALASAAPWFLAVQARCPEFAGYFFVHHHVDRFREPFDHGEPFWFYVPELLVGLFPWTLLPVLTLLRRKPAEASGCHAFAATDREQKSSHSHRESMHGVHDCTCFRGRLYAAPAGAVSAKAWHPAWHWPLRGDVLFYLLSCGWTLLFFSLAGCKRPAYILPALPPLALALGCYLDTLLPRQSLRFAVGDWFRGHSTWAVRATALLLLAALAGSLAALARGLVRPEIGIVLAAGTGGVLGGLLVLLRYRRPVLSWGLCGIVAVAVMFAVLHAFLPAYARQYSLRGLVRRHVSAERLPVASYPRRWDSISFYLQRDDVRAYTPERRTALIADLQQVERTLVFVKGERWLTDFLDHLPSSLEFVPHGRQGYVRVGIVRRREAISEKRGR
jgi:4-amino-4-deoxy-L-arabinose transferase-like glycosyltransferase